jgi:polyhydroxyalkanoate synthesis regulator phasin
MAGDAFKDRRPVVEALERMWAQAVTAMSSVEDETARVVQRAQTVAGWSQDEVRRQMNDLTERLVAQRKELEQGLEERVRGALLRLRVPRRDEVQALVTRVDRVAERLEKLERGT